MQVELPLGISLRSPMSLLDSSILPEEYVPSKGGKVTILGRKANFPKVERMRNIGCAYLQIYLGKVPLCKCVHKTSI